MKLYIYTAKILKNENDSLDFSREKYEKEEYTKSSDVYAFGIILFKL